MQLVSVRIRDVPCILKKIQRQNKYPFPNNKTRGREKEESIKGKFSFYEGKDTMQGGYITLKVKKGEKGDRKASSLRIIFRTSNLQPCEMGMILIMKVVFLELFSSQRKLKGYIIV